MKFLISIICFALPIISFPQPNDGLVKLPKNQLKNFQPEDLLSLTRISGPKFSPSGEWIMYGKTEPNLSTGSKSTNLFAVKTDGSKTIALTDNRASDFGGQWLDDENIVFISTRLGKPQVFKKTIGKNNAKMLTVAGNGVNTLNLSPDGTNIAYTADVQIGKTANDMYPDAPDANVYIYDDLPVRHWDHWEDVNYSHLFVSLLDESKVKLDLMPGEPYETPVQPFGGAEQIAWSPDGTKLVYTSKKDGDYEISTDSDLFLVDLISKETKNITQGRDGYDMNPQFSPNGQMIAFHSQEKPGFEADRVMLMVYNMQDGSIKEISSDLDQWVGEFVWKPSGTGFYFSAADGKARTHIYEMDMNGAYSILTEGDYNYGSVDVSPDGKTLVATRHNFHRPNEIVKLDLASKKVTKLTSENNALLASVNDITWEPRYIETEDGKKMHVWYIYPPNFDKNKKYPTLIYCQGGPQSTIDQFFSYRWNFFTMASQGYVVVAPNRRGMPGFGQDWNDAISEDWGGMAMKDILAATDHAKDQDFVDSERMAAVGASAGGFTTFWLAGNHNDRFKAFISHCGVFNLVSMYGSTEELFFAEHEFGGPYWEGGNYDDYLKNSPHTYVDKWDTPILIITGQNDFRVPYTQSLEAYTAAQRQGIPSRLLVFPTENHWVLSLQNAIVWQKEFFRFLDEHLN
ncbi:MAG: S9 family peptidase [Candidatus Kapaibacteriales bacterium]